MLVAAVSDVPLKSKIFHKGVCLKDWLLGFLFQRQPFGPGIEHDDFGILIAPVFAIVHCAPLNCY